MPENSERDFPPATPGAVLRSRVLSKLKVTQDELAKALGVSRFTVNQILNGRRSVTAEMAVRLAHVLDTSPELWLRLQMQRDLFEAERKLATEMRKLPRLRIANKREDRGRPPSLAHSSGVADLPVID